MREIDQNLWTEPRCTFKDLYEPLRSESRKLDRTSIVVASFILDESGFRATGVEKDVGRR